MIFMDVDGIVDFIEKEYLPRARWWPWKNTLKKIELVDYDQYSDLLFLLIGCNNYIFQLPLMRVNTVPTNLQDRGFCIESECFVEAEYTRSYLRYFSKLNKGRYKWIDEKSATIEVYHASPITLESTNAISVYESNTGKIVLKSYRLLPEVNVEVKILERLSELKYAYIPRIHGFLYFDNLASGILMEYIRGEGDGGTPFYKALLRYLNGDKSANEIRLAAKLGMIVGELHLSLNRQCLDSFFGVEDVSEIDVFKWTRRLHRMYIDGLRRLDEVLSALDHENRRELEYWRDIVEKEHNLVYDAISKIERYGSVYYKARTHQDLHLAQMIYTGDQTLDFVITDFEGEPGRSSEERLLKEPLLRDIASMIRSFHYLSHAAIMDALKKTRHEASILMIRDDPSFEWRKIHVYTFFYTYIGNVRDKNLLGKGIERDPVKIWGYLYPWIVERAIYEFYYESLYRPLWVSIPIAGLNEIVKYLNMRIH